MACTPVNTSFFGGVKRSVVVVLGNPPYSNFGMMNKGRWILGLLEDYKKDLHERKLNLDDDYIKFIRWGQWRIEQSAPRTGGGILAFITNNSYVDGITHRRMRQSLMETFGEVHILDLHGSSNKQETAPDGGKDENVFDIQQGVAIGIFTKGADTSGASGESGMLPNKPLGRVLHTDMFGPREAKYKELAGGNFTATAWDTVNSAHPSFFFVSKSAKGHKEYHAGWSIVDMFTVNQSGLKTDRDELFFAFEASALAERMRLFYSPAGTEAPFRDTYRVSNSSSYDLLGKRSASSFNVSNIRLCLARPFDNWFVYYDRALTSRPAWDVMQHVVRGRNVSIVFSRQASRGFRHVFVTRGLTYVNALDTAGLFGSGPCAPLYLYPQERADGQQRLGETETSSWPAGRDGRVPNLCTKLIAEMEAKLGLKFVSDGMGDGKKTFGPEDVFDYIYAIFHSPTYRKRYAEFLKIDFPRVPLTSDRKLLWKLVSLGRELVALHLLESPKVNDFVTRYPKRGSDTVGQVRYVEPDSEAVSRKPSAVSGRVFINDEQYFEGVRPEWFEFHIGGYQVLQKWLKDRKGRKLSNDDITHYQRVVVAIKDTIRLMAAIDAAIPKWPVE